MYLTPNQVEVLKTIAEGNPDGTTADLDEILERVSYKPTKAAIQFTIRSLVKHDLIEKIGTEKRRDRQRVLIAPTALGLHFAAAFKKGPAFVSSDTEESFEELVASI